MDKKIEKFIKKENDAQHERLKVEARPDVRTVLNEVGSSNFFGLSIRRADFLKGQADAEAALISGSPLLRDYHFSVRGVLCLIFLIDFNDLFAIGHSIARHQNDACKQVVMKRRAVAANKPEADLYYLSNRTAVA